MLQLSECEVRVMKFNRLAPAAWALPWVFAVFPVFAQETPPSGGAAAPAAAAAATAAAKLDNGDTAWMLAATALVLMMTVPGLALFYAGMVRKKNVLATMMQSFTICCLVTITWMV